MDQPHTQDGRGCPDHLPPDTTCCWKDVRPPRKLQAPLLHHRLETHVALSDQPPSVCSASVSSELYDAWRMDVHGNC